MTVSDRSIDLRRISPAALAYLGDAVYELHVRQSLLLPLRRVQAYHRDVVSRVRAEAQAKALATILPSLSDTERTIVQRGRNGSSRTPRNVSVDTYRQATAFETLLGYLHLSDTVRLAEILALTDTTTAEDSVRSLD